MQTVYTISYYCRLRDEYTAYYYAATMLLLLRRRYREEVFAKELPLMVMEYAEELPLMEMEIARELSLNMETRITMEPRREEEKKRNKLHYCTWPRVREAIQLVS